ncbi:hypothetical protein MYCTH_94678 [Thermothelomyces thermophilus ATCC 42464]|uniref:Uncharacterized protein n=1 Tax=Thermothelomyces thermophilus (strain ATCC 42464 / BCRC 31852 / DSM 1799) TaxID=573729 RepID=G2QFY3_THET4|nr:uncharacterized protein MYCTH_94678 [Thermothelomyces thermophilus ATCC 42464]AEO59297.1 hypothetical protein MYCTH_94678 [Thermothelomyces thermophilus ATCC 42464]
MCKGIIGHCQCLRCIDHPAPGKIQRVDFCEKKKHELVGITSSLTAAECRFYLAPCENLTLVRIRDPDACHFKGGENAVGGLEIKFTPINAAVSIAKAALSALAENEANHAHGAAAAVDDGGDNMDLDRASFGAGKHEADIVGRDSGEMDINPGKTSQHAQNTDNNMDVDSPLGASKADKQTPAGFPLNAETPVKPTSTSTVASADNTGTDAGTLARTRPFKTPSGRTPLPTSRPPLPLALQKTTGVPGSPAVTTAERAGEDEGARWTHQETVKLLLLRCKEVAFERMVEFIPGRDAAACMDRLAQIAVRHGYEAYI